MLRYALTIFVSAFLLFQVQPLIGRFILPWFGGGPSIWTTCMLFFQVLLLGGYLYAHLISVGLSIRAQVATHLALLIGSLLCLPIAPGDAWKPVADGAPSLQILLLLLATVGGPYFMLASTGPLMQRWFNRTDPGKSPYRLYALSNVGSLLALLSYPFVFEPMLKLKQQASNWGTGYALYVMLAAWCAVRLLVSSQRGQASATPAETVDQTASVEPPRVEIAEPKAPGWGMMILWVGLSAFGSSMLLATTNQLCIDVATVPFLWVLPLSLYLLTFIICFDNPQWYDRRVFGLALLVAIPAAIWVLEEDVDVAISDQIWIYSAVLFACCMTCHGELVSCRPHPKYLTLFFVLVSAGGAVGGLFVAIAATRFFLGYWEYHISLIGCCAITLIAWCVNRAWQRPSSESFWIQAIVVALQAAAVAYFLHGLVNAGAESLVVTIYFGVYVLIQFLGLAMTAALQNRSAALYFVWLLGMALQIGWLCGFAAWQFPELMSWKNYGEIAFGASVPLLIGFVLLSGGECLGARIRSVAFPIVFWLVVFAGLGALKYQELIAWWQFNTIAAACGVALVIEWTIRVIRGQNKPSWGFVLWIPVTTLLVLASMRLQEIVAGDLEDVVHLSRNFYGVLRVRYEESDGPDGETTGRKVLTHGQIQHGFQYDHEYWGRRPTTYYGQESGFGLAIRLGRELAGDDHKLRVGVVGLGTGTTAAYGETGEYFRFYDINAAVLALSVNNVFTYLRESQAKSEVVLGDARIVMERELAANQSQQFDVLAIDAFSSDAIPVHLLTAQCAEIYAKQLRPGGILAVHISNRFLDLNPISRGMAQHLGWTALQIENDDDHTAGVYTSTWILLTNNGNFINDARIQAALTPWKEDERTLLWTDDYSGLWQVLSF